jgi:dolichol kinase
MSATEQPENIKCCVLLYTPPSEILQMLEEVYDKAAMMKMKVHEWHIYIYIYIIIIIIIIFMMAMQVSIIIHSLSNCKFQQIMKTLSV